MTFDFNNTKYIQEVDGFAVAFDKPLDLITPGVNRVSFVVATSITRTGQLHFLDTVLDDTALHSGFAWFKDYDFAIYFFFRPDTVSIDRAERDGFIRVTVDIIRHKVLLKNVTPHWQCPDSSEYNKPMEKDVIIWHAGNQYDPNVLPYQSYGCTVSMNDRAMYVPWLYNSDGFKAYIDKAASGTTDLNIFTCGTAGLFFDL